jgi:stage V sporulation protein SpoVS
MASSLLFKIKSQFDAQGVQDYKTGFSSVIGVLGKTAIAAAGLLTNMKLLGGASAVLSIIAIPGIIKGLFQFIPEAAAAEMSFVRLRTQLELFGKGSQENIKLITDFAETTARKTRFSAEETQQALTIAIRRTGSVEKAMKAVGVAQDFAAATGKDLVTATFILNSAMAGNYRTLAQLTNLRRSEIEALVRQGTLLDKLAKLFGGAAAKEADTLIVRYQRLANTNQQVRQELGKLVAPTEKLIVIFKQFRANVTLGAIKTFELLGNSLRIARLEFAASSTFVDKFVGSIITGKGPLETVRTTILETAKALGLIKDQTDQSRESFVNFQRQYEITALKLGKSGEEQIDINKRIVRADEILRIARSGNLKSLTKDQLEFGNQFKFFQDEIASITEDTVRKDIKATEERRQNMERLRNVKPPTIGLSDVVKEMDRLRNVAKLTGQSTQFVIQELQKTMNVAQPVASAMLNAFSTVKNIFDSIDTSITNARTRMNELKNNSAMEAATHIADDLKRTVEAFMKPIFEVKINMTTPPETIQNAVRAAVINSVPQIVNELIRNSRKALLPNIANKSEKQ